VASLLERSAAALLRQTEPPPPTKNLLAVDQRTFDRMPGDVALGMAVGRDPNSVAPASSVRVPTQGGSVPVAWAFKTMHANLAGVCVTEQRAKLEAFRIGGSVAPLYLGNSGWRPIESAPPETVVLVGGNCYAAIGRRHLAACGTYVWKTPGGAYFMNDPTHWMPLPEPPS
jgi:hypothetical protein